jgi:streptogramin lyase
MLRHIEFAQGNRGAAILVIVLIILASSRLPLEAQNRNVISGLVKNASAEPVDGALVRVRSAEMGLTFMVVSQAQGRYSTPNLPPGKYTVEGIGGGYQSNPAGPVEVSSGRQAKMDLVLSVARKATPPRKRMTQADYEATMPEGPAKKLITTKCVLCHDLEGVDTRTLRILGSRQEWEEDMGLHKYYMGNRPERLSDDEVNVIVDYMAKNFSLDAPRAPRAPRREEGRSDPNSHLPGTLLKGAVAKYVVMEFNLPRGASPHDISVDSQGIAWTSEHGSGLISRYDAKAFSYTQFPPPAGEFPSRPSGSAVDPQGIVWNVDNGKNARLIAYNPKTGEFKTYDMPAPPRQQEFDSSGDGPANMNSITFQDGFVWGSGLLSGQIYKLDPVSGGVITYPVPKGQPPYGLAFDKNKMVWYSAQFADEIVKLDPATGRRTHYRVLTPKADLRHIQTDADGNVWASAQQSDKLIKVDARTGKVTEYAPPTELSGINTVDVDAKHNLIWVGEAESDRLGRFDPRTNTFTEFPLPSPATGLKRIAVDPSNPNRVWWCANGSDRIGYVEIME